MKLGMWVVMGTSTTMWSVVTKCTYLILHLHICSDWLITKKSNIQSSVWATLMKLDVGSGGGTTSSSSYYSFPPPLCGPHKIAPWSAGWIALIKIVGTVTDCITYTYLGVLPCFFLHRSSQVTQASPHHVFSGLILVTEDPAGD